MRLVPPKEGRKRAKMKTKVKFGNTRDSYVKLCPGIEENDEKILWVTQNEVSAPKKGKKVLK